MQSGRILGCAWLGRYFGLGLVALSATLACGQKPGPGAKSGESARLEAPTRTSAVVPPEAAEAKPASGPKTTPTGPKKKDKKGKGRRAEVAEAEARAAEKPAVPLPALQDHETALLRQLAGPWGAQRDRDDQAQFPLVDSQNWRRVRFRGVPHFAAFTYGEDHNLVSSAFVVKTEGKPTSRRCMALFESEAIQEYATLGGRRSAISERKTRWRGRELLVHTGDGELSILFSNYRFSVAWAAYPAYDDGCLVYATVVLWGDNPGLAQKVRDRWAIEGFERYVATTSSVPERRTN
jgi:hypothetical protein